jgi:hypothetical protein
VAGSESYHQPRGPYNRPAIDEATRSVAVASVSLKTSEEIAGERKRVTSGEGSHDPLLGDRRGHAQTPPRPGVEASRATCAPASTANRRPVCGHERLPRGPGAKLLETCGDSFTAALLIALTAPTGIRGSRRPATRDMPRRSPRSPFAGRLRAHRPTGIQVAVSRRRVEADSRADSSGNPKWSGSASLRYDSWPLSPRENLSPDGIRQHVDDICVVLR